MYLYLLSLLVVVASRVAGYNFEFESIQLQDEDTQNFPDIAFGNRSTATGPNQGDAPECKAFPGSPEWPLEEDWAKLNSSLDGVLLKPSPPGAVCYNNSASYDPAACSSLLVNAANSRFYINDPVSVLTSWAQGNTCPATPRPQGNCTQGGFPTYVVNATTVKQIQIAVNFARNRDIRLVIKNTGHDFGGRANGAGAISVWTHYLKSFEFLSEYTQDEYSGMAAKVASGLEAWEMFQYMDDNNMTLVVPGGYTVAPYGGWMAGGGHSPLGSTYGLGSDQPLSLQIVTADGRFVTADPDTNQDLFYALRGGGPSTYGIVTSAIVKAYPYVHVTEAPLSFAARGANISTFWQAHDLYNHFGKDVVDAGGTAYSYVSSTGGNTSATFRTTFQFPGKSIPEVTEFLQPLFLALQDLGFATVGDPVPRTSTSWGPGRGGLGDMPGDSRFASRLFPYKNWQNDGAFAITMRAVRDVVEAGYMFHGIHIAPPAAADNGGVNPAFRTTIMHADVYDFAAPASTPEDILERHARLDGFMNRIRDATPEGGAYINEADVLEPDWQASFFGENYPVLAAIKNRWDPWGLFWAPTTPASEGRAVRTRDGLPSQNGPLCRV